jgi:[ribosomal protein S5]-alanine N-acetyltransferase
MITLETERLFLREFLLEDAKNFFDLNNDSEVIKFTGDKAFKSIEEAEDLVRNYEQYQKYKQGRLTVILKETNEFLGWCGLKYHANDNLTDIGYRFKRSAWNKGYATESARANLDYGFNVLHLDEIVGHAMHENHASIRVFEKLGMHYVKDIIAEGNPSVLYQIQNPLLEKKKSS